jgi:hypothetical protein
MIRNGIAILEMLLGQKSNEIEIGMMSQDTTTSEHMFYRPSPLHLAHPQPINKIYDERASLALSLIH